MNLDRFNLNLFVALDAVLNARNLTDAARSVFLTQPAMSVALKKLRGEYNDELVIYSGGEGRLTPLAEALRPRVKELLQEARDTLKLRIAFDPATSSDTFRLVTTDILELIYFKDVIAETLREAPGVRIQSIPFTFDSAEVLFRSNIDIAVVSQGFASERFASEPLIEDVLACLVWNGNAAVGERISPETFFSLRHVGLAGPDSRRMLGPTGVALMKLNEAQNVVMRASTYSALPHIVIGTELVATTIKSFADYCATILPVRVVPLPIPAPTLRFVAQWQPYRSEEPAMRWMLAKLRASAARIGAAPGSTPAPGSDAS